MDINKSTLDRRVRKLRYERESPFTTGQPITEEQREIDELKKQIKRLEVGRNILKRHRVF